MPPPAKINCAVILYDINTQQTSESAKLISKIAFKKFFEGSKDKVKVILSNVKNARDNVSQMTTEFVYYYNPPEIMGFIKNGEPSKGNWLESLMFAINKLKQMHGAPGIITLQLLFITDFTVVVEEPNEALTQEIINEINQWGIYLYIAGPELKECPTITSAEDVRLLKENLRFKNNIGNLTVVKGILRNTINSVICDCKTAGNLFFSYVNPKGSQPWQVPLTFGTKISFPVATSRVVNPESNLKLKASGVDKAVGPRWVLVEDETKEVNIRDVISGIKRYGKFVPIEDKDKFKPKTERTFAALGFTDIKNIPEHLMSGEGSHYVFALDNSEAFPLLVDMLAEKNKCVVAKKVYRANVNIKYVALMPKPDYNPKCLILFELPYSDDVLVTLVEKSVQCAKLEENIVNEVYSYLDSLDIQNENCAVKVPLTPNMANDCTTNKIINAAADKHMEKPLYLDGIDINMLSCTGSEDTLEALKNVWPLRTPIKQNVQGSAENDSFFGGDDEF